MNRLHMPERSLQPPEPTLYEIRAGEQRQLRMEREHSRAMLEVMSGHERDFWIDGHDAIQVAVQEVLGSELTAEECWAHVVAAVHKEALAYATACSEDCD